MQARMSNIATIVPEAADEAHALPAAVREPAKARVIAYWICTGLITLSFLSGGFGDVVRAPPVVAGMTALGYPGHFTVFLGVWKILGACAIVAPGFPRLKEWAYAGMIFDLT